MDPVEAYHRLEEAFGAQGWWPAESPFEVMVGAVLTQQTTWSSVEAAIGRLKEAGLVEPGAMAAAPEEVLMDLIRPAGFYRQKARRLRSMAARLVETWGGDLDAFFDRPEEAVREELLSWEGVGPETADSILLYAAGFPTFVVDAYTLRFVGRMWSMDGAGYREAKDHFEARVPRDARVYQEFHGLIVELGKRICRGDPLCPRCPLRESCHEGQKRLKAGETSRGRAGR
jgi:endonuclease-3 related protein